MNFGSLKAKIILLNFSIVGFMSAGAGYALLKASRDEENSVSSFLQSDVNGLSENIQDQFYERYGDVKAFSAALGSMASSSVAEKRAILNSYVALYGIYDLIIFVDADGRFIASNDHDIAGNPVQTGELARMNFAGSPWFESAKKGEFLEDKTKGFTGVALEQPHFDPLVELVFRKPAYGTSFTTAVVNPTGKLVGYVTTRAGFRWVEDLFKRAFLNQKAAGMATSGFLLFGSDGKVYLDYVPDQQENHSTEFNHDKAKLSVETLETMPELHEAGVAPGKAGFGRYTEVGTGDRRSVAFQPVNGPKIVNGYWNVASHFDDAEAFASRDSLVKVFVAMIAIAASIALGTSLMFGLRLSRALQSLVSKLYRQGEEVRDASGRVSETSERLSSAASQQAAALQETVAAVNEISAMVGRTADMATQSRNTSQNSRNVANEGKRTVDEMLHSMTEIKESNREILNQVEEGNKEISQIVKVIAEIGNKTKVINDIVFQTKLLSFNASVEAARAGEHGKGFAVVAEEVGNLAQMSGSAAKEISDLLEQSVVKVQSIVDQTGRQVESIIVTAREKVSNGEETAKQCASMLEQILLNAEEVNSIISEIATSAQEQARGVQEINSAMSELESVTQQNASSAVQASSLSGSLMVQSEALSELVVSLNRLVSGSKSGTIESDSEASVAQKPAADRQRQVGSERNKDHGRQVGTPETGKERSNGRPLLAHRGRSTGTAESDQPENIHFLKTHPAAGGAVRSRAGSRASASGSNSATPQSEGSSALQSDETPRADDHRFED